MRIFNYCMQKTHFLIYQQLNNEQSLVINDAITSFIEQTSNSPSSKSHEFTPTGLYKLTCGIPQIFPMLYFSHLNEITVGISDGYQDAWISNFFSSLMQIVIHFKVTNAPLPSQLTYMGTFISLSKSSARNAEHN